MGSSPSTSNPAVQQPNAVRVPVEHTPIQQPQYACPPSPGWNKVTPDASQVQVSMEPFEAPSKGSQAALRTGAPIPGQGYPAPMPAQSYPMPGQSYPYPYPPQQPYYAPQPYAQPMPYAQPYPYAQQAQQQTVVINQQPQGGYGGNGGYGGGFGAGDAMMMGMMGGMMGGMIGAEMADGGGGCGGGGCGG